LTALADARPGPAPGQALHGLLDWEKTAIVKVAEQWGDVDRSHRKLAHRASRLDVVHMSESSVLRVLTEAGVHLPEPGRRERRPPRAWPEWAELVPGVIFIYDFAHFRASKACAVAVMDVLSRYWLATVVSVQESSVQVEVAFTRALVADGKDHLLDQPLLDELATGVVPDRDELPVLLAISDNGPQMTSKATAAFMASVRIGQHFGRPGTPNDQAWIESLFGHLKDEHPHLDKIEDVGDLEAELDRIRPFYNTVRLHQGLGYVTPEDEHTGRGDTIRAARGWGLRPPPGSLSLTHLEVEQLLGVRPAGRVLHGGDVGARIGVGRAGLHLSHRYTLAAQRSADEVGSGLVGGDGGRWGGDGGGAVDGLPGSVVDGVLAAVGGGQGEGVGAGA
jgi:transposase InsO family protein